MKIPNPEEYMKGKKDYARKKAMEVQEDESDYDTEEKEKKKEEMIRKLMNESEQKEKKEAEMRR